MISRMRDQCSTDSAIAPSFNFISLYFDSTGDRILDLPYARPTLYRFNYRARSDDPYVSALKSLMNMALAVYTV